MVDPEHDPSPQGIYFLPDPGHAVVFSQDESLAACICCSNFPEREAVALIAVYDAPSPPAGLRILPVRAVFALHWVPGTLTLLLLHGGQISLLDADASSHALLRSVTLPAALVKPSLGVSLSGEAVLLLYGKAPLAGAAQQAARQRSPNMDATLALYNPSNLNQLSLVTWTLPSPPAAVLYSQESTMHASQHSVACCFGDVGTRVWDFSGSQLGRVRFWARGLDHAALSCTGFLAGIRASCHEVLCGRTGASLFKLPMLVPDLEQPAAKAFSVAWAGPDGSALHACYRQCDSEDEEGCTLLYRLLSFG